MGGGAKAWPEMENGGGGTRPEWKRKEKLRLGGFGRREGREGEERRKGVAGAAFRGIEGGSKAWARGGAGEGRRHGCGKWQCAGAGQGDGHGRAWVAGLAV